VHGFRVFTIRLSRFEKNDLFLTANKCGLKHKKPVFFFTLLQLLLFVSECEPPKSWPREGSLRFDGVSVAHGLNPPVLNKISFQIRGGEKVRRSK
jgi:ABC-type multidrug transport system fused ATPase/permease subunit